MEAMISVGLMAVVFVLVAQSLASVAAQRRTSLARSAAQREVENVMERLMARPFDSVDADAASDLSPSAELLHSAPHAELRVLIAAGDEPPAAKQIRVEVVCPDPAGRPQTLASLTAWKHGRQRAGEEEAP